MSLKNRLVETKSLLPKLEQLIRFRFGKDDDLPRIVLDKLGMTRTDGWSVTLPEIELAFTEKEDNIRLLAERVLHEADRARELREISSQEAPGDVEGHQDLSATYHERHFSHLTENPAFVDWIDDLIKDHRAETTRREQIPGSRIFQVKRTQPAAMYLRPSTNSLSEFDMVREYLFQTVFFGKTFEKVPEKHRALLEELAAKVQHADSFEQDPEIVEEIYNAFKDRFDIKQRMRGLPSYFGRNGKRKNSRKGKNDPKSSSVQNVGSPVKEREGRSPVEKRPKFLAEPNKNPSQPQETPTPRVHTHDNEKLDHQIRHATSPKEVFAAVSTKYSLPISEWDERNPERAANLRAAYANEISRMRSLFEALREERRNRTLHFDGDELDLEGYQQATLERQATGMWVPRKYFLQTSSSSNNFAWAVLSDVSRSTGPSGFNIMGAIRASLLIQGEALSATEFPFGLFAFSEQLYVLKGFEQPYSSDVAQKIASLTPDRGTDLGESILAVKELLGRTDAEHKGIIILTDGQATGSIDPADALLECYQDGVFPFTFIVGKKLGAYAQALSTNIGREFVSVVGKEDIGSMPTKLLQLIQAYGLGD